MHSELSFTGEDLLKLKDYFKNEINSNRKFEEISTVEELYEILEDREALTDNVLIGVEPNFQEFVRSRRSKVSSPGKLVIPQAVVRLVKESCPDDWEKFGLHLKISNRLLSECRNVEDVLIHFLEKCEGMSPQEMSFRLIRALEKCGKGNLRNRVVELLRS